MTDALRKALAFGSKSALAITTARTLATQSPKHYRVRVVTNPSQAAPAVTAAHLTELLSFFFDQRLTPKQVAFYSTTMPTQNIHGVDADELAATFFQKGETAFLKEVRAKRLPYTPEGKKIVNQLVTTELLMQYAEELGLPFYDIRPSNRKLSFTAAMADMCQQVTLQISDERERQELKEESLIFVSPIQFPIICAMLNEHGIKVDDSSAVHLEAGIDFKKNATETSSQITAFLHSPEAKKEISADILEAALDIPIGFRVTVGPENITLRKTGIYSVKIDSPTKTKPKPTPTNPTGITEITDDEIQR